MVLELQLPRNLPLPLRASENPSTPVKMPSIPGEKQACHPNAVLEPEDISLFLVRPSFNGFD